MFAVGFGQKPSVTSFHWESNLDALEDAAEMQACKVQCVCELQSTVKACCVQQSKADNFTLPLEMIGRQVQISVGQHV